MGRALDLHQGEELVDLHPGLLLLGVAQQVGHDGLVVLDVGAERDTDGFTLAVGHLDPGPSSVARVGLGPGQVGRLHREGGQGEAEQEQQQHGEGCDGDMLEIR